MLTPIDIHNKEFKRSFRGYNEDEIDDFLDQVVNDYEMLYRENNKLKEELAMNQKNLEQYHHLEKNLQDTLLVAQKTADEVMTSAKTRAEEIRKASQQECENLRQQAELDIRKKLDGAAEQLRAAGAEYDDLVKQKRQFVTKMKSLIQTEMALLDEDQTETSGSMALVPEPEKPETENN